MVLFKWNCRICKITWNHIYIPLWSYSNTNFLFKCEYSDKFTFHYGPIQMKTNVGIITRIREFTFHYGPIQIHSRNYYNEIKYQFTFHYGPIQISKRYIIIFIFISIYIPLWSYSNFLELGLFNRGYNLHSTMVLFK